MQTRQRHGFSDVAATRQMHEQFARADIAGRHVLRDQPDEIDQLVDRLVSATTDGSLLVGHQ